MIKNSISRINGGNILLEFHKNNPKLSRLFVYGQSLFVVGSFFWFPLLIYYFLKKYKSVKTRITATIALIIILCFPFKKNSWFQNSFLLRQYLHYFQIKVKGAPPNISKPTIFGIFPHGIIPFSVGLTSFGDMNKLFNNLKIAVATATRLIPVFSHVLQFCGSVDASVHSIDQALSEGNSIGLSPGGIAEMFWGYPQRGCLKNEEYAVINQRKGFIRLAIKHGADIVPVFVFGSSKLFHRILLPQIIEKLSRYLRMSLILFFGKFGLPIPFEIPVLYALGSPISTIKDSAPAPEEVDFIHKTFCVSLVKVFEEYKQEYGWSEKTLKLV